MFPAVATPASRWSRDHGSLGAPYALSPVEVLATNHVPTWLLVSAHGWRLLAEELASRTKPREAGDGR